MQRIPTSPPQIAPLNEGLERPQWSVMIPVYNCCQYLKEAIESVLQQDLGANMMQIEVVDDCSTDADIETLVKLRGKGRVAYHRQPENVGSLRNFETCINRSKGHYVHLLHGDDRVKPGYYAAISDLFNQFPEAGAAYCAWDFIDADGNFSHHSSTETDKPQILRDWLHKLAEHPRLQYVTITVKRKVYEHLGSFYLATYGEDWEMWARIAKHYPTAYTPESLAEYREHKNSITWQSYQNGQNIKDIIKVTAVIASYLPRQISQKALKPARQEYIHWILNATFSAWLTEKNHTLVYNQITAILRVYIDMYVLRRIAIMLFRMWTDPCRKLVKPLFR